MKTWFKGTLIGTGISVLLIIIFFVSLREGFEPGIWMPSLLSIPFFFIFRAFGLAKGFDFIIYVPTGILLNGLILGTGIGWIVQKIKSRRKNGN
tara:strand:+ start:51 stop:332 length:282 start_codon:yes stop_codon:yes gene_type:complete